MLVRVATFNTRTTISAELRELCGNTSHSNHPNYPSETHYRLVESVAASLDAAVQLAEYNVISVLWEGFQVNRHGVLLWLICGYK